MIFWEGALKPILEETVAMTEEAKRIYEKWVIAIAEKIRNRQKNRGIMRGDSPPVPKATY